MALKTTLDLALLFQDLGFTFCPVYRLNKQDKTRQSVNFSNIAQPYQEANFGTFPVFRASICWMFSLIQRKHETDTHFIIGNKNTSHKSSLHAFNVACIFHVYVQTCLVLTLILFYAPTADAELVQCIFLESWRNSFTITLPQTQRERVLMCCSSKEGVIVSFRCFGQTIIKPQSTVCCS